MEQRSTPKARRREALRSYVSQPIRFGKRRISYDYQQLTTELPSLYCSRGVDAMRSRYVGVGSGRAQVSARFRWVAAGITCKSESCGSGHCGELPPSECALMIFGRPDVLHGRVLSEAGHVWLGMDISRSMLEVLTTQPEGTPTTRLGLWEGDLGEGLPLRSEGTYARYISPCHPTKLDVSG
eukprot:1196092-Prorocentrum_minimum.AAC.5